MNFTRNGNRLTVTGEYVSGWVSVDLSDVDVALDWGFLGFLSEQPPATICSKSGSNFSCCDDLSFMPSGTVVTGVSVYVVPRDKKYGGEHYGGAGNTGRRSTLILNELIP